MKDFIKLCKKNLTLRDVLPILGYVAILVAGIICFVMWGLPVIRGVCH